MANNGPYYEEGVYRCEVVSQGLGESSTGTPQFVIRVKVLSELSGGEEVPVNSYERTSYLYLSEKAIESSIKRLKVMGFAGTSFRQLDPNAQGFHDFSGTIIEMVCKHETYDGKDTEKWGVRISESKPLEIKAMDQKKLRDLDNLFGKQLKEGSAIQPPRRTQNQSSPPPFAEGVSDDDMPF
jgi:hypothetical protein